LYLEISSRGATGPKPRNPIARNPIVEISHCKLIPFGIFGIKSQKATQPNPQRQDHGTGWLQPLYCAGGALAMVLSGARTAMDFTLGFGCKPWAQYGRVAE